MWRCRLVKFYLVFASVLIIAACATSDKKLVEQKCSACHPVAVVFTKKYSENQWHNTINAMTVRGMKTTPEENARILDYLVKNHGTQ